MKSMEKILAVKKKYESKFLKLPGVISIGIAGSEEDKFIKISVNKNSDKIQKSIPKILEGFKVIVQDSSEIKAYE